MIKFFTGVIYNCCEQYHEMPEMVYIKLGLTKNMSVDEKHVLPLKLVLICTNSYLTSDNNTTNSTEIIHYISVICANI